MRHNLLRYNTVTLLTQLCVCYLNGYYVPDVAKGNRLTKYLFSAIHMETWRDRLKSSEIHTDYNMRYIYPRARMNHKSFTLKSLKSGFEMPNAHY
jgi:hypothetical protein